MELHKISLYWQLLKYRMLIIVCADNWDFAISLIHLQNIGVLKRLTTALLTGSSYVTMVKNYNRLMKIGDLYMVAIIIIQCMCIP